jgi:hypothetical protein
VCTNRRFPKVEVDEASKVGGSRVALTLSSKAKQVKVLQRHEEAIREAVDRALESGVVELFFLLSGIVHDRRSRAPKEKDRNVVIDHPV